MYASLLCVASKYTSTVMKAAYTECAVFKTYIIILQYVLNILNCETACFYVLHEHLSRFHYGTLVLKTRQILTKLTIRVQEWC